MLNDDPVDQVEIKQALQDIALYRKDALALEQTPIVQQLDALAKEFRETGTNMPRQRFNKIAEVIDEVIPDTIELAESIDWGGKGNDI